MTMTVTMTDNFKKNAGEHLVKEYTKLIEENKCMINYIRESDPFAPCMGELGMDWCKENGLLPGSDVSVIMGYILRLEMTIEHYQNKIK